MFSEMWAWKVLEIIVSWPKQRQCDPVRCVTLSGSHSWVPWALESLNGSWDAASNCWHTSCQKMTRMGLEDVLQPSSCNNISCFAIEDQEQGHRLHLFNLQSRTSGIHSPRFSGFLYIHHRVKGSLRALEYLWTHIRMSRNSRLWGLSHIFLCEIKEWG